MWTVNKYGPMDEMLIHKRRHYIVIFWDVMLGYWFTSSKYSCIDLPISTLAYNIDCGDWEITKSFPTKKFFRNNSVLLDIFFNRVIVHVKELLGGNWKFRVFSHNIFKPFLSSVKDFKFFDKAFMFFRKER